MHRHLASLATGILWLLVCRVAFGQFENVINVPPNTPPGGISSSTQLNVWEGGYLPGRFEAGLPHANNLNVEVNISGGYIGGGFQAGTGSMVNITGGRFGYGIEAYQDSTVNIAGGIFEHGFRAYPSSRINLIGNEFLLDGQPVVGLGEIGSIAPIILPRGSTLTGVYADGTPFAIVGRWDNFDNATLFAQSAALPPIGASGIISSRDDVPVSIRHGQTLHVDSNVDIISAGEGSTINVVEGGNIYVQAIDSTLSVSKGVASGRAYGNSLVSVNDGELGDFFAFHDSTVVNLYSGEIGYESSMYGGELNVYGGKVDDNFRAFGGTVNFFGGTFYTGFSASEGTIVNVDGGEIVNDGIVATNSTVNFSRGYLGYLAVAGGNATIRGGRIRESLSAGNGSTITLIGGEFLLDGRYVGDTVGISESLEVQVPDGSVLSGFLEDGTPFTFSSNDLSDNTSFARSDRLEGATLILKPGQMPPVEKRKLMASQDPLPIGLRNGQELIVDMGGTVPDFFGAGHGSTVHVEAGGTIGREFEAAGAVVNVTGGQVGYEFKVSNGAVVNLDDGEILSLLQVFGGGSVNCRAGTIGDNVRILEGGSVNISGGLIGEDLSIRSGGTARITGGGVGDGAVVYPGGIVEFSGGEILGQVTVQREAAIEIRGGEFRGPLVAQAMSMVHLYGRQFLIDGVEISETLVVGSSLDITARDITLSGQYLNNRPFSFRLNSTHRSGQHFFSSDAVVRIHLVPEPSHLVFAFGSIVYIAWSRRTFAGS